MMMKSYSGLVMLLASGILSGVSQAAPNMKLFGTLIEPPACTINDGGKVDVDFGSEWA